MSREDEQTEKRGSALECALETARLGMWNWDLRTGDCFYSDSWFRMLGYEPGELPATGDLWIMLLHPDDRDRAIATGDRHIAGETDAIETELRLRHKQGHWVSVLDRGGIVERDEDGLPVRIVGVQTDISQQKATENELAAVNERFRLALAASQTGIWHFDIASQTSHWDERTRQIFGLDGNGDEIPRKTWHSFLHPDDREEAERKHSDTALLGGDTMDLSYRIVRRDGSVRHIETLVKFAREPSPHGSIVGTVRDVTDEVAAADALLTEKERLRTTLKGISDAVISTDADSRIAFVNPAAAALLGRPKAELVGLQISEVFAAIDGLASIVSGTDGSSGEIVTLPGAEHDRIVRAKATAVLSRTGFVCGHVFTLQDVTTEQRKQQELAYAARHDALTGLLNRAAFDCVLNERVADAQAHPFALLYIDLDHFKALNDFAGHAAGDRALVAIADEIRTCLPGTAAIARLGGDEFAALFASHNVSEAEQRAQCILSSIQAADLGQPAGYRQIGASIGIVMVRENGLNASDVLAHADDTCYAAKAGGRNRFLLFSEDTRQLSSSLTAARIVGDIADAMEEDRLKLFGQEIRMLADPGRTSGRVEVLARLVDRNGRMIAPCEFIPAAERFGRASALDRWIIRTALSRYGKHLGAGELLLGFNLSAQTLSHPGLWDFVEAALCDTGAPCNRIVFEITETAAVTNFEAAERFVAQARGNGCRVSLDDFGAGLSSFDYLRRFPIDSLKINGSFIENIASSRFDQQIVASINRIAEGLGYDVVAEKIENTRTLEVLDRMKVKFGQGFLFHRPEPLDDILARLQGAGSKEPGRRTVR